MVGLGIAMPSVAELWFMVFNSRRIERKTKDLEQILDGLPRWDFIETAAMEFGRIKTELRQQGRVIPDADIQIAAIAKVNDLVVLTADAHFNNVRDLKTENWLI
jgi:tRNA(fMet)-specific endonuclease VapC